MSERLVVELEKIWEVGQEHLPAVSAMMQDAHAEVRKTAERSSVSLFADPMFKEMMRRWNIVRDNFATVLVASAERVEIAGDAMKAVVRDYADTDDGLATDLRGRLDGFAEQTGGDANHRGTGG